MKKLPILLTAALFSLTLQAETLDILKAGGKNDGRTLNTQAIDKAIARLSKAGGGTLVFPAGTYLTGPITLRSNITLEVQAGAVLSFTDDFDQYMPYVEMRYEGVVVKSFHPLIGGWDLENITLKGEGTLEGNGRAWWNEAWRIEGALKNKENVASTKYQLAFDEANRDFRLEPESDWKGTLARRFFRPPFIQFMRCRNIRIEGLHIQNSPFWTVNPEFCENLWITGLTITNPPSPNTDGINPSSCRNVHISDCHISVGDDCITIKSGRDLQGRQYGVPCENITITNCTMLSGHGGVVIGSEMSGGVRNVTIGNCVFDGTDRGIRIKASRGRGGCVEQITVSNIVMRNIRREAFIITLYYGNVPPEPFTERTPVFRDILISNVKGSGIASLGGVYGIPESPVTNVDFHHIHLTGVARGLRLQDASGISLTNFYADASQGPLIEAENGRELYFSNVKNTRPVAGFPVLSFKQVEEAMITACYPLPGSASFLNLTGDKTRGIVLTNNYLNRLETPFVLGEDVSENALIQK